MRYLYTARLVPIGEPVNVPDQETGRASISEFHDKSFEIERTSKTKPEVWVNHDRAVKVGNVVMLYVSRAGWWEAEFLLDPDLPNELEVGQPVSIGLSYLKIGSGSPYLREISIVPHGAVKGAEVISRSAMPPTTPPAARVPVANVPARAATAAPPIIYRTPNAQRDAIETAELRRRLDWLEDNGYRVTLEEVLDNLKSEVGYGRDMSRPGGQVLALR